MTRSGIITVLEFWHHPEEEESLAVHLTLEKTNDTSAGK
jgi:hypothetical protein